MVQITAEVEFEESRRTASRGARQTVQWFNDAGRIEAVVWSRAHGSGPRAFAQPPLPTPASQELGAKSRLPLMPPAAERPPCSAAHPLAGNAARSAGSRDVRDVCGTDDSARRWGSPRGGAGGRAGGRAEPRVGGQAAAAAAAEPLSGSKLA